MKKKKLPVGVQNFRVLREENSIYVDKTEGIHSIATGGNYYFLSRPRRFGKSLLLSTLSELFQGSKELFSGLWIEDKWDWTQKSPVLHISFAAAGIRELGLAKAISNLLDRESDLHKIEFTKEGNGEKFRELIEKVYAKHGRVVVLIDEYDKPIVDHLDDIPLINEHKALLRDFYVVLKDTPQYLRFVFITGITRFSKINIFSALNHLKDISSNKNYATLLGYTQEELEHHFEAYMPAAEADNNMNRAELLAELKHWYNGYSWDGITKVYNPFSI
jgi:Predicted AAA-ATPase